MTVSHEYAYRKRHTEASTIDVEDTVLVRQEKRNKLTTQLKQTPYTVINRKGSEVRTSRRNNHIVSSHNKKFQSRNVLTQILTMTFKFNANILTLDTDKQIKMKMCNQHKSTQNRQNKMPTRQPNSPRPMEESSLTK